MAAFPVFVLGALFHLALAPLTAWAVEKKADEAARAFARGKKLFEERNYIGAIEEFNRAYHLRPHHAVQCSIARCFENLNRFVEATEHYRRCLAEGAEDTVRSKRVGESLKRAEKQIAWLDVSSPTPGGKVVVDGDAAGEAPLRIPLNPGRHVVEVQKPGATPASITLALQGGERRTVSLAPRSIVVDTAATVSATRRPVSRSATSAPARRTLRSTGFWIATVATIALAGVTTVCGVQTIQRRASYLDAPTEQGYEDFVSRRLLTNVFLGVTLAAAGTSTVLFFYTDFGGSPPAVGEQRAGVGLRGTF